MKSSSSSSSSGIGFLGLLAIVFITLKLLGVIQWSWFWVLSPLWGGCLLSVVIVIIAVALVILAEFIRK